MTLLGRTICALFVLAGMITGCSKLVDPLLRFTPGSYIVDTGREVQSVRDVTRARTVIVVWFRAKCSHCQAEMQSIQNEYERLQNMDIEVVGVAVATPRGDLIKFARQHNLAFPIVLDHGESPIGAVPYTVLVVNGNIQDQWVGVVMPEAIIRSIR